MDEPIGANKSSRSAGLIAFLFFGLGAAGTIWILVELIALLRHTADTTLEIKPMSDSTLGLVSTVILGMVALAATAMFSACKTSMGRSLGALLLIGLLGLMLVLALTTHHPNGLSLVTCGSWASPNPHGQLTFMQDLDCALSLERAGRAVLLAASAALALPLLITGYATFKKERAEQRHM